MLLGLLVIYPLFPREIISAVLPHHTGTGLETSGSSYDGAMTFLAQIIISVSEVRKRSNTVKHGGSVSLGL